MALNLYGSGGTLRLSRNGGPASIRSFVIVTSGGTTGGSTGGGSGPTTSPIGVDTDGVPYFEPAGVSGGATVQADTDGVPYFV